MKLNWTVRFKNPLWLSAFLAFILTTVYQALGMFDIVPAIPQSAITDTIDAIIKLLTLGGILIDPTTKGLGDSTQALQYSTPKSDR